jgi:hypothetical protein
MKRHILSILLLTSSFATGNIFAATPGVTKTTETTTTTQTSTPVDVSQNPHIQAIEQNNANMVANVENTAAHKAVLDQNAKNAQNLADAGATKIKEGSKDVPGAAVKAITDQSNPGWFTRAANATSGALSGAFYSTTNTLSSWVDYVIPQDYQGFMKTRTVAKATAFTAAVATVVYLAYQRWIAGNEEEIVERAENAAANFKNRASATVASRPTTTTRSTPTVVREETRTREVRRVS